jgi:hypothetical protein
MPKIPCCFMCSRTPADLVLFGKLFCEECAHNLVSDAAAQNRRKIASERTRRSPLPLMTRDGVMGVMVGDEFVPSPF